MLIEGFIAKHIKLQQSVKAIVFTAGISENNSVEREKSLADLEIFGIVVEQKNCSQQTRARKIGSDDGKVWLWVVSFNEELTIAWQIQILINNGNLGFDGDCRQ